MALIFEINHIAHIHLFRNLVTELRKKGKAPVFLVKSSPVISRLVKYYNLPIINLGTKGSGLFSKYVYQFWFLFRVMWLAKKYNATIGMGVSMNLPLVSKFSSMKSIVLDDDDITITPVFAKYANKATVILTPSALKHENRGKHHISYPGYHELAYLHPNRFKPDESVMELLSIKKEDTWFVIRFNAFNAHHDIGEHGMNIEQKKFLVRKLLEKGKVFISTESSVDPEFEHLLLPDRPELMHSILFFATLYIGESQTMTTEAAVLGTPALKCNTFAGRLSIPNELEKEYGLCYSYLTNEFEIMLGKIDELLAMPDLKSEWKKKRMRMLQDKIDVTAFFVWFVENFPSSAKILKKDPGFPNRFKEIFYDEA